MNKSNSAKALATIAVGALDSPAKRLAIMTGVAAACILPALADIPSGAYAAITDFTAYPPWHVVSTDTTCNNITYTVYCKGTDWGMSCNSEGLTAWCFS